MQPTVIITEGVYQKGKAIYDSLNDINIIVSPEAEQELGENISKWNPFAVVVGTVKYVGPLYQSLREGGVIARFGVGCDGINFLKASERKQWVTNTPGVLETTVAEFTVFLAAEVLRKTGAINQDVKNGSWPVTLGFDLKGKNWTILGLGKIGTEVAKILSLGFGVNVSAFVRQPEKLEQVQKDLGMKRITASYEEAVSDADIVSVLMPANETTYHFMNKERLMQMKKGAVLINTSRGSLIDEAALYDLLHEGHLSAAGLDVFEKEPYVPIDSSRDLRHLSNVIMSSHVGSATVECAARMTERVVRNLQLAKEGAFDKMDIVLGT